MLFIAVSGISDLAASEQAAFKAKIQPLVLKYCQRCHNVDKMTSGIRVDQLDGSLEDRHLFLWKDIQKQIEDEAMPTIRFTHYGVMAILRYDPRAIVTGCGGFGFGRMDIQEYWEGTQVLPTLTFEAGVRRRTGERGLIDGLVRAHWATSRSLSDWPMWSH